MLLHSLLRQYNPGLSLAGVPNVEVGGVREDSRQVQAGDLFIARPGSKPEGSKTDGLQYVADAKSRESQLLEQWKNPQSAKARIPISIAA